MHRTFKIILIIWLFFLLQLVLYTYIYIYVYVPRDNGFISKKSVSKLFSVYKKIKEARRSARWRTRTSAFFSLHNESITYSSLEGLDAINPDENASTKPLTQYLFGAIHTHTNTCRKSPYMKIPFFSWQVFLIKCGQHYLLSRLPQKISRLLCKME